MGVYSCGTNSQNESFAIADSAPVYLRQLALQDVDPILALLEPAITQWFPHHLRSGGESTWRWWLERRAASLDSATSWVIVRRQDSAHVGMISFYAPPGRVSFWLGQQHIGRGYAQTALLQTLDSLRDRGVRFVRAQVRRDNLSSVRLLERCRFRRCVDFVEGIASGAPPVLEYETEIQP